MCWNYMFPYLIISLRFPSTRNIVKRRVIFVKIEIFLFVLVLVLKSLSNITKKSVQYTEIVDYQCFLIRQEYNLCCILRLVFLVRKESIRI